MGPTYCGFETLENAEMVLVSRPDFYKYRACPSPEGLALVRSPCLLTPVTESAIATFFVFPENECFFLGGHGTGDLTPVRPRRGGRNHCRR